MATEEETAAAIEAVKLFVTLRHRLLWLRQASAGCSAAAGLFQAAASFTTASADKVS